MNNLRIRKLEWGPYPNPALAGPDVAVALITNFGRQTYTVQRDPWGPGYMAYLAPEFETLFWDSKGHETLEDAKAAAQADYESRILAGIVA